MSYEDDRPGLGLSADTRERLRELFAGQTCDRCGEPAARLSGGRFYCPFHYLRGQPKTAEGPRVYRCTAPGE